MNRKIDSELNEHGELVDGEAYSVRIVLLECQLLIPRLKLTDGWEQVIVVHCLSLNRGEEKEVFKF